MKKYLIGFFISFIYFLILLLTLSDYGINEDSPFHFMRGQYYLGKILTGKELSGIKRSSPVYFVPGQRVSQYKINASEEYTSPLRSFGTNQAQTIQEEYKNKDDAAGIRYSFYKHDAWTGNIWDLPYAQGHPAISDMLMALSNRIFYEKMGIFGDIESYHLYIIFVSALTVFFIYLFAEKIFGLTVAIFSSISLALYPFYFAESHFNIKDPVQSGFFTIAIISLYMFVTGRAKVRWYILLILSVFLALGTKWNIAFMPFIILPWLLVMLRKKEIKAFVLSYRFGIYLIAGIILPFILLIGFWPFLWTDTLNKLLQTFSFYSGLAIKNPIIDTPSPYALPLGFNLLAILRAVTMTPTVLLIFFFTGLLAICIQKIHTKYHAGLLLILWMLIPILRVSRQDIDSVGSIRHFMEFIPPMAIIASLGISLVVNRLSKTFPKINRSYILSFSFFLYLLSSSWTLIKIHPNENLYFNILTAGTKGATKNQLYSWLSSYDNVYRQGINWLNKNAEKNARLAFLDGTMFAISPLWLRSDISIGSYFSGYDQKGEYIMSLEYPTLPSVFGYAYLENFLEPLYVLEADGQPVLKIWQNSKEYLKDGYREEIQLPGEQINVKKIPNANNGRIWEANLGSPKKITRLILKSDSICTQLSGVWSTLQQGQENFIKPEEINHGDGEIEIDFPGGSAENIRLLDTDNNSCLYGSEIRKIFSLR